MKSFGNRWTTMSGQCLGVPPSEWGVLRRYTLHLHLVDAFIQSDLQPLICIVSACRRNTAGQSKASFIKCNSFKFVKVYA